MYNNQNGMYSNYEVETNKETFKETKTTDTYVSGNMGYSSCTPSMSGIVCPPIYECPQERIIHREIMHEVPQE